TSTWSLRRSTRPRPPRRWRAPPRPSSSRTRTSRLPRSRGPRRCLQPARSPSAVAREYRVRVTHYSRLSVVVFDVPAADAASEVAFWQAATGTQLTHITRFPEYHGGAVTGTLALLVQQLGDGPARVHVDIHTDDLDAEVERLEALGAERVSPAGHWVIMRDP